MNHPLKPRVLIVDNDPIVRTHLEKLLSYLRYSVACAMGEGSLLRDNARKLAQRFRPHTIVVDLRLGDDEDKQDVSGFEMMKYFKNTPLILYSSYLNMDIMRQAFKDYNVMDVVKKNDHPHKLEEAVLHAVQQTSNFHRTLEVIFEDNWSYSLIIQYLFGRATANVPQPSDIADILGQLFNGKTRLKICALGENIPSTRLVSRGHSVVVKAFPDDLEPVAVKFAPTRQIQQEQENYKEHIAGRMPNQFCALLNKTNAFWDVGAAVYSFLGSTNHNLPSFSAFYQKEPDPQKILKPLRHFFEEVWAGFYQNLTLMHDVSLFEQYDEFLHLTKRLRKYPASTTPPGFDKQTNPFEWLLQNQMKSQVPQAQNCITHGDLHGDNLFTDGLHSWAIDFERTGRNHAYRDFAELEMDIFSRLLAGENQSFEEFHTLAMSFASSLESWENLPKNLAENKEVMKAVTVSKGLRACARKLLPAFDPQQYRWALCLDAIFVALITPRGDLLQKYRAWIIASALCDEIERNSCT